MRGVDPIDATRSSKVSATIAGAEGVDAENGGEAFVSREASGLTVGSDGVELDFDWGSEDTDAGAADGTAVAAVFELSCSLSEFGVEPDVSRRVSPSPDSSISITSVLPFSSDRLDGASRACSFAASSMPSPSASLIAALEEAVPLPL